MTLLKEHNYASTGDKDATVNKTKRKPIETPP